MLVHAASKMLRISLRTWIAFIHRLEYFGSSRIGWNSKFARDFHELGCVALVNTVLSILVNSVIPYKLYTYLCLLLIQLLT